MSRRKPQKKKPKSLKQELIKTAMDAYELPGLSLVSIQSRGNREFCVEGCKGILEYSEGKVRINGGDLIITFTGDNVDIDAYSDIQTVITGNIFSVSFEGKTEA